MSRQEIINELREWKQMLDEGLIRQSDYEEHQKLLLKKLRTQSSVHTSALEKPPPSISGSDFFSTALGEVNPESDLFMEANQSAEKPGSDFFQTGGKSKVSSPQSNTFGGDAFATGGKGNVQAGVFRHLQIGNMRLEQEALALTPTIFVGMLTITKCRSIEKKEFALESRTGGDCTTCLVI